MESAEERDPGVHEEPQAEPHESVASDERSSGEQLSNNEENYEEEISPTIPETPSTPVEAQSSSHSSTIVLAKSTLESVYEDKTLKKNSSSYKIVEKSIQRLDELMRSGAGDDRKSRVRDSIMIFEALRACCRTKSARIQDRALDCLSKLFSFRALDETLLVNPPDSSASNDQTLREDENNNGITPPPKQKLIDAAVDTIADCFLGEGTDPKVELQIVRALSNSILAEGTVSNCHGASLLKAIRTIYNVFVFSLNPSNQTIAQASLTQIMNYVFEKIDDKVPYSASKRQLSSSDFNNGSEDIELHSEPLTLAKLNNLKDDTKDVFTDDSKITHQEQLAKDAFLVFRTMSKICSKPLDADLDMRSHAVRSKLLSLHLIYSVIKDHINVFLSTSIYLPGKDRVTFVDCIKQYLCLALSRNAASPLTPVFEITLEIMWLLISNLRVQFRREIPVFLTEIYFPIVDLTTSTAQQKRYFLSIIQRLCNDPRTLIEFYLNYDCNPGMSNITEMIVEYLSKLALTRVDVTSSQKAYYQEQENKPLATYNLDQFPLLSTSNLSSTVDSAQNVLPFPLEFALKMMALNCVVSVLRSLSLWTHRALNPISAVSEQSITLPSGKRRSNSIGSPTRSTNVSVSKLDEEDSRSVNSTLPELDDPAQFESLKQRKTQLTDCIKIFNTKPKKAIKPLKEMGFLKNDDPLSIAKWLLETDGLDLAAVGDYLGEGDEFNISIMHAFVDQFDFTNLSIVDALRDFLQRFRLPGEGQKIDRFMLKFAERFVDQNPGVFSDADTAYVLSYSLIMLNTDLHSSQIKRKMTLQEFLENNAGIDNGKDLPKDFMVGLFNEIAHNEIKLQAEQHQALISDDATIVHHNYQQQSAFNFFSSRDLVREAYMQVSKEISSKTELMFKNLNKSKNKDESNVFYAASHVEHVKSIFINLWMSFLAALTPPFREYDDPSTSSKCLEGLKISIKISAIFGIEDARQSFIGALVQFCNLQNLEEIKVKNVNAMIILLEVALSEGNFLKESWRDVLLVTSQMERLQLLSKGIDKSAVPDVTQARLTNYRASTDSMRTMTASGSMFDLWGKKATPIELAQEKHHNQTLSPEISKFISSTELIVLMDNIFTKSSELSGNAIIDFINALTTVSLDEIESSQHASTPRMFSLQKMVDVCYYNMDRIKVEWSPLWAVMGRAFNRIATNSNLAVVFFAIDSLRQLSIRFLDIDELSGFKFQKEFLQPFEYTVQNSTSTEAQEMILDCFRNFILTKSHKIKSGWKPILKSLQHTAQSNTEMVVVKTQQLACDDIVKSHFESIFNQDDAFAELVNVFKEISKNKRFQKQALHALETLRNITRSIAELCFHNDTKEDKQKIEHDRQLLRGKDIFQDVWFPLLYCFNDTIMTAEDLEVRSRALNYMFDSLVAYGHEFDEKFWENICVKLLFPIFGVLSKHWEVNQFNSHDDISVWLSTTLIQALRNLIALFTHYFESLNKMLDGFLGLLVSCICQENDTIARIGRSCLQQLILQNVTKFDETHWDKIGKVFERLFKLTTANELFDFDPLHQGRKPSMPYSLLSTESNKVRSGEHTSADNISKEISTIGKSDIQGDGATVARAQLEEGSMDVGTDNMAENENEAAKGMEIEKKPRRSEQFQNDSNERLNAKNSIVIKCVLQLLMIELLNELFSNEEFEHHIPDKECVALTQLLEKSYEFARDFNDDYGLRTRLVDARVVDKIPNLLKQETNSAAVLIDIMFKLYLNREEEGTDRDDEGRKSPQMQDLAQRLVAICMRVVSGYIALDSRTMEKSINSWRPVIVEILQGYYEFDDADFARFCPKMYQLVIHILDKSIPSDLRHSVKLFLTRVGELYLAKDVEIS